MKEIVIEEYRDLKRQLEEGEDSNKNVLFIYYLKEFIFICLFYEG